MDRIKLTKDRVRPILSLTFPEYKGRTFFLTYQEKYNPKNYWSGGTRYYFKVLEKNGDTLRLLEPTRAITNPYNDTAHQEFKIQLNWVVVEHCIFCGHNMGIRLYVNPNNELIPKKLELKEDFV